MPMIEIVVDDAVLPAIGPVERGWRGEVPRLVAVSFVAAGRARAIGYGPGATPRPAPRQNAMMRPGGALARRE